MALLVKIEQELLMRFDWYGSASTGDNQHINILCNRYPHILNSTCEPACCRTALQIACEFGKIDVVKTLIEFGADLNIKDKNGLTALQIIQRNDPSDLSGIAKVLLSASAV